MSKPFEWKDFTKKYNDLNTNNFPTLSKSKQVQDTLKFKFSSKAQQGVKFDSSVTSLDATTTEADFSSKINIDEVKGLELGFKAKSKPSTDFSAKFDDKIIPVAGSSLTLKLLATAPSEQSLGATFGYANQVVNLNLGFSYPLTHKLFGFIDAEGEKQKDLDNQKPKVDLDFVLKPVETHDIYVGGNATLNLPVTPKTEEGAEVKADELTYSSKVSVALINNTFNGGVFVEHKKEKDKKEAKYTHETKFGTWAYTEVDDLSGGAQVSYNPTEEKNPYKGFSFEAVVGLQRDADSKISSKVQVIPDTIASVGYEQKLSKAAKLSFGYSFLLNKTSGDSKTKSSAYLFGLELSH